MEVKLTETINKICIINVCGTITSQINQKVVVFRAALYIYLMSTVGGANKYLKKVEIFSLNFFWKAALSKRRPHQSINERRSFYWQPRALN